MKFNANQNKRKISKQTNLGHDLLGYVEQDMRYLFLTAVIFK